MKKNSRLDLLSRLRRLEEDRRQQELHESMLRVTDAEDSMHDIRECVNQLIREQEGLLCSGKDIDLVRHGMLHEVDVVLSETLRKSELALQDVQRQEDDRNRQYAEAWKRRRAAEKRYGRTEDEDRRAEENRTRFDQLEAWLSTGGRKE